VLKIEILGFNTASKKFITGFVPCDPKQGFTVHLIRFISLISNLEMAINFPAGWMENYNKIF